MKAIIALALILLASTSISTREEVKEVTNFVKTLPGNILVTVDPTLEVAGLCIRGKNQKSVVLKEASLDMVAHEVMYCGNDDVAHNESRPDVAQKASIGSSQRSSFPWGMLVVVFIIMILFGHKKEEEV